MRQSTVLLVPLLYIVRPPATAAQDWIPDSAVVRLAWGAVNVLVRADTISGVHVWAETSPIGYQGQQLAFAAFFDPQSLDPWVHVANAVVTITASASDSAVALETPALVARDGSRVVLLRRRKKTTWEKHAAILLVDREERHPWYIDARLEDAQRFLQALFLQAGRSRQVPESTSVHESNPLDRENCPQPLPGNPVPWFPENLRMRGQSGEVWVSFVVQADSTPDPASFRVLLSDGSAFADATFRAVRRSRFRPGRVGGIPVAMRAYQRFIFRIR